MVKIVNFMKKIKSFQFSGDYKEGSVVDCPNQNCRKKFQHVNCGHCQKPKFFKNLEYRQGVGFKCINCHSQTKHLSCPYCFKGLHWKNDDYKETSKVDCKSCTKSFQHINCPHCVSYLYFKKL